MADGGEIANTIKYEPILFINPDIEVKVGLMIEVTQHGITRKKQEVEGAFSYTISPRNSLQRIDTT